LSEVFLADGVIERELCCEYREIEGGRVWGADSERYSEWMFLDFYRIGAFGLCGGVVVVMMRGRSFRGWTK